MSTIVELRNVTQRYGEHAALDDFSLEVRRAEFFTLFGPSGSGKTTLLRLVARDASSVNGAAPEITPATRVHVSWQPRQTLVFPEDTRL